jgi:hypothetical protein
MATNRRIWREDNMRNREVIAYMAGIIDGEGTITLTRVNKTDSYRTPVVSVSSTSYEILEFIHKHYGGAIVNHKTYQKHHKQSWVWKITYDKAIQLVSDVYPYLTDPTKRYRADLLISKYKKVTVRNGRYTEKQKQAKLQFEQDFFQGDSSDE